MNEIAEGIYYEDTYLGVTLGGMVFTHGIILIDAPLRPEDARFWRSALLNMRGGSHRVLVTLDAHPDRTLGIRAVDATLVAQQKTAQVFRTRPNIFKGQANPSGADWETYSDAIGMRWAVPDITFITEMSLHWGGPEVILEHHPGPAPGASWAYIPEEKIVFVGDAVVIDQPPFFANADIPAWLESLDVLLEKCKNCIVISGRGGPAPIKAVRAQARFLKSVQGRLEKLADKQEPLEAIEKIIPALLKKIEYTEELHDRYFRRLRHGLQQYYARHYQVADILEESEEEEEAT